MDASTHYSLIILRFANGRVYSRVSAGTMMLLHAPYSRSNCLRRTRDCARLTFSC